MAKDKKVETPTKPALRWIPDSPAVYPGQNLVSGGALVFAAGTVVGIGEPLGESGQACSEEFAQGLIEAGHAEIINAPVEAPADSSQAPAETPAPPAP